MKRYTEMGKLQKKTVSLLEVESKTERQRENKEINQIKEVTQGIEMSSFTVCLIHETS